MGELREVLLSTHLIAVAIWIGAGFAEGRLGKALRDGAREDRPALLRHWSRNAWVQPVAIVVAAATGIFLSALFGWGFFRIGWLGMKQAIMALVLVGVAASIPSLRALRAAVKEGRADTEILEGVQRRIAVARVARGLAVFAILLAVFGPS